MSWTTAGDLKAQLCRLWARGELARSLVSGEPVFPLRLAFKGPTSVELAERFSAVRAWIAELAALPRIRIEWREVNHRILGLQRVPASIWVDDLESAAGVIRKQGDVARFRDLLALTRSMQPTLVAWLGKRPLHAIELGGDWAGLLAVVDWVARHPRPAIYLRQVDVPGIHTKFIEAHRGVLTELLDLALPPDAIDRAGSGTSQFAARYGFRDKPVRIRFRLLDPGIGLLPGPALPDITLDADSFTGLTVPIRRVFITENETNFLAFPQAAESIVIFGAGYGWDALARARWLAHCSIHYWGDIDTHGFAILDQLRGRYRHVASFLMDRETLMAHDTLWGEESDQVVHDLPRLNDSEQALYDELRDNRIRTRVRLEQERVGFRWLETALRRVLGKSV